MLGVTPARPIYTEDENSNQESQQESLNMSPTYSQMVNVISLGQDFEINNELLRQDFYLENKIRKEEIGFSVKY